MPCHIVEEQSLKDPYIFGFIAMTEEMDEREIENQLVKKVTKTKEFYYNNI
jgi:predicted nuclease of restriction endonuclease-like (RecB) superfamily